MINVRVFAVVLLAAATVAGTPAGQPPIAAGDQSARADFTRRVQAYTDTRHLATLVIPAPMVSADPAQIRHASDALAFAIRTARAGARQGDIFSPGIAAAFRRMVGAGCQDAYAELLAVVTEELESPLPAPAVHARWPVGAPLPTMPPDLLAALPRLPAGLEYRFMNRDLVLLDVDANLIVDFVPDAMPSTSSSSRSLRSLGGPTQAGEMQQR
jgi:hypothetical protein